MRVGVPQETVPGERRVALAPESVARLAKSGVEVTVERGAGRSAYFPDDAYSAAGASLGDAGAALGQCRRGVRGGDLELRREDDRGQLPLARDLEPRGTALGPGAQGVEVWGVGLGGDARRV